MVDGPIGAGVTSVTIKRSDGSSAQATVLNRWYLAWWPGTERAVTAQVTGASPGRFARWCRYGFASGSAHSMTEPLPGAQPTERSGGSLLVGSESRSGVSDDLPYIHVLERRRRVRHRRSQLISRSVGSMF